MEIPSLSQMTLGHYVGLLLACVQALVIGAVCSDEAFESNQWGGLGVFAAFIGLVWIVLRNVPSITTDINAALSSGTGGCFDFAMMKNPDALVAFARRIPPLICTLRGSCLSVYWFFSLSFCFVDRCHSCHGQSQHCRLSTLSICVKYVHVWLSRAPCCRE